MKSIFFYPTKINVFIGFVISQLFPFFVLRYLNALADFRSWAMFELVIIGCLLMWRVKPDSEFDEREKEIVFKWKSRMLDYSSATVILPLIILCLRPEIEGWDLYTVSAVPIFIVFVTFSLLAKKEIGYFFHSKV